MNPVDRAIAWLAPGWAVGRMRDRIRLERAQAQLARSYEGANVGRLADGWWTTSSDATTEALWAGRRLRDRARDLVRNNPWAHRAVQAWRSNAGPMAARTVLPGAGDVPRLAGGPADRVDSVWSAWWERAGAEDDADFGEVQSQIVAGLAEAGECLVRRIDRRLSDGYAVPMQVQVLEADFLDDSRDRLLDDGGFVLGGIEFGPPDPSRPTLMRRRAYWLWKQHPGAGRVFTRAMGESVRVPAEEIAHVYEPMRAGQARGVTWFAPIILRMRDLDDYDRFELIRKKAESCLSVWVSDDGDPATMGPTRTNPEGQQEEMIEPGMVRYLPTGKTPHFQQPASNSDYTPYMRTQEHACAAGLGLTYELMTGDLSQVNFSSARIGLNQFKARVRLVQDTVLVPRGLRPVREWFVRAGKAAGVIDPAVQVGVRWTPPRWESIQPVEEATAALIAARSGQTTMPELLVQRGLDPIEVLDELQRWNAELLRRGIVLDSDPRQTDRKGTVQKPDPGSTVVDPSGKGDPGGGAGRDILVEALRLVNGNRAEESLQ